MNIAHRMLRRAVAVWSKFDVPIVWIGVAGVGYLILLYVEALWAVFPGMSPWVNLLVAGAFIATMYSLFRLIRRFIF